MPTPQPKTSSEFQKGIMDSMELCPFTIEIYPETLHIGDILYIKMSFENKSDMITWALPQAIGENYEIGNHEDIVTIYFHDARSSIQFPCTASSGKGYRSQPTRYIWQPIYPNQRGIDQFINLKILPRKDTFERSLDEINSPLILPISPQSFILPIHDEKNSDMVCLYPSESYLSDSLSGYVVVTIRTLPGKTFEAPINKTITVKCPQRITFLSRPQGEFELYYKLINDLELWDGERKNDKDYYEFLCKEYDNLITKTTAGTWKNQLQMDYFQIQLAEALQRKDKDLIWKTFNEIERWLATLPEIENSQLKKKFILHNRTTWSQLLHDQEKEMLKFNTIFGPLKKDWEHKPLDLNPWKGRNPYRNPKLHPSNETDSSSQQNYG